MQTAESETPDVNVAALVEAARSGDQAAWNALVDRYTRFVWSIARSFRLSSADAADAVQMTWLRLVENLDRISDPDRLPSWLGTTVRRECLQHLRRSSRDRSESGSEFLMSVPDDAPPLETAMLDDERDRALWRAMGMLGGKCQQLLRVLMATPPPAYTDVAATLEMPIGSIGPARKRCLAQLKKIAMADEVLSEHHAPREGR